jgi:glycosyl transferase family 87
VAGFELPRPAGLPAGLLDLPGLRTFRSRLFREAVALAVGVIGVLLVTRLLATQIGDPRGQFAIDFGDYYGAAREVARGHTPYAPAMLAGPVPSQGIGAYRYPPVFAQLLVPLTSLPLPSAAFVWLAIHAACIFAAVWIAGNWGGARRTRERVLWSAVACLYFFPAFDALWKGNVSGVVAYQVALILGAGFTAGLALAGAVLLKVSPATLVPAMLFGGRRGDPDAHLFERRGLVLCAVGITAASLFISPQAWLDYGRVLPNLLGGFVDYPTNLAPASLIATRAPQLAALAPVIRVLTLALSLGAIALAVWLSTKPGGWPAAVTAGAAAMLFLPSSIWYHYLVVLLPLAAFAWPRARINGRAGLLAGAFLVYAGFAWWLPFATVGTLVMLAALLAILWPERHGWKRSNHAPGTVSPWVERNLVLRRPD